MYCYKVTYSRLKNLGSYENERFDVEIVVNESAEDEGNTAEDAFDLAKSIVHKQILERENNISDTGVIPAGDIPI